MISCDGRKPTKLKDALEMVLIPTMLYGNDHRAIKGQYLQDGITDEMMSIWCAVMLD